ncbi:MAG: glycogen/starch synthase [Bacteroidota bacterium]
MKILHISAECYPAAKAGGLGDVVGALPKYLNKADIETAVVLPKYHTKWMLQQQFTEVYRGTLRLHQHFLPFRIERVEQEELGYTMYVANIPSKFDRPGVYADPEGYYYRDELERFLSFQQAVLHWLLWMEEKPAVLHCHDHHTGLIPFLVKHSIEFSALGNIPTVFTIHNGEYHGAFSWNNVHLMPTFYADYSGLIDWQNAINPLAAGIKNCWRLTTVSPNYLEELRTNSNGLEWLLNNERPKSSGIINGIDQQVWNPKKDPFIKQPLGRSLAKYKAANKAALHERFNLQQDLPIFTFIGRLVREKGADLLPDMISRYIYDGHQGAFIILGSGEAHLQDIFRSMKAHFVQRFDAAIEYNEGLAHQLYAGSDFLLMPSRVEPCGLNQMYAMRYGTVPVVRSVGGLRDTVSDIGEPEGRGIRFDHFSIDDGHHALIRATALYEDQKAFSLLQKRISQLDFSWEQSAAQYINIYQQITNNFTRYAH